MRSKTFYILVPKERYLDQPYYTTKPEYVREFLLQVPNVEYDVYEVEGDNIIEVSEELSKKYHISIDKEDEIILSYGGPLSNICIYTSYAECSFNMEFIGDQLVDAIRTLYACVKNLTMLKKYLKYDTVELNAFITFLKLYIKRLIVAIECDIYDLSIEQLEELKFKRDDTPYDIYDENYMLYITMDY